MRFTVGVLALLVLVACTAVPGREVGTSLGILSLNVWQEGTQVEGGFEKLVDVILASEADVVALSEVRNYEGRDFHQRLVAALAARGEAFFGVYAGGDAGLVSRWPIEHAEVVADFTSEDSGCVVAYELRLPGGRRLLVGSAHLDYKHYALYLPRGYDGRSFELIDADGDGRPDPITDVALLHAMDAASTRDECLAAFVRFVDERGFGDGPVLLAGDFNEASHFDWTAATRDLQDHHGVEIAWRNSVMLQAAGYRDSWRELHPDPATHPGSTWPSEAFGKASTSWTPVADERDRIDFVYHNGRGLEPTRAALVGSPVYFVRGERLASETDDSFVLADLPWPSDHKGVLVDFRLTPLGAPRAKPR